MLALVIASVGIYGVVAYAVGRRQREIGIRLALGANARAVLGSILRRTMRPVGIGAVIGISAATALSIALASLVPGLSGADPISIGVTVLLVLVVAVLANVVPARHGLRVNPVKTLRWE